MSLGGEEGPRREPEGAAQNRDERRRIAPGRVMLLALFVVLVLAVIAVAAVLFLRSLGDELSGTSVASDSIDSGPEPRVRLTNAAGQVQVEGVEGSQVVEYEVTKHALGPDPAAAKERASDVPVNFSREESTVVLETDGGRDTGADYALRIPAGGSVEVESEAGDVEVSGLSGDVRILAEAGDVEVRESGSNVSIEAPQGDVVVEDVSTDTGQAELVVGSGDVALRDLIIGTLEASVGAGDVTLSGRFSGSGRIFVETGDITANLPPEDTRELTLETRVGDVVRETPEGNEERSQEQEGS